MLSNFQLQAKEYIVTSVCVEYFSIFSTSYFLLDVDECVDFDTAVMSINDVFFRDSTNEEKAAAFSVCIIDQINSVTRMK